MKRKSLVVLTLLLIASLMAAMGTGALDVFSAERDVAMKIVTDEDGLISIKGDGVYAFEDTKQTRKGALKLDFTSTNQNFEGKGFNTMANIEFHDVFTITNDSPSDLYVWLEADGWGNSHTYGLNYVIGETTGDVTRDWRNNPRLLDTRIMNYENGKNGCAAYVMLEPGEFVTVDIEVDTTIGQGLARPGYVYDNWSHTVKVKANPSSPITYYD